MIKSGMTIPANAKKLQELYDNRLRVWREGKI